MLVREIGGEARGVTDELSDSQMVWPLNGATVFRNHGQFAAQSRVKTRRAATAWLSAAASQIYETFRLMLLLSFSMDLSPSWSHKSGEPRGTWSKWNSCSIIWLFPSVQRSNDRGRPAGLRLGFKVMNVDSRRCVIDGSVFGKKEEIIPLGGPVVNKCFLFL